VRTASVITGMPIKSITNDCKKEKGPVEEGEYEEEEGFRTRKRREEKMRRNAGI
jgi:hypothetical protein